MDKNWITTNNRSFAIASYNLDRYILFCIGCPISYKPTNNCSAIYSYRRSIPDTICWPSSSQSNRCLSSCGCCDDSYCSSDGRDNCCSCYSFGLYMLVCSMALDTPLLTFIYLLKRHARARFEHNYIM